MASRARIFSSERVPIVTDFFAKLLIVRHRNDGEWGIAMRLFIACAIILSTVIGLGGCVGHHEKAVVAEPLKVG